MTRTKKTDQETPKQTEDTTPAPEPPERDENGAPTGAQPTGGSGGERKKETADVEISAQAGSGTEQASSDAIQDPCVYCGPTVRGVARQYTTYQGGIPNALRDFIKEHPEARRLIVSTAQFPAYRRRLDTPGTAEAKLYKRVKEQVTGAPRKPSDEI